MTVTEVSANTGQILDGFRTLLQQNCDKILPEARQCNNCCSRLGEEIVYRKWRELSCIAVSATRVSRLATGFWGYQVILLWMG